ncbi:putative N-acyl-L-amino acid amidohydrolase [Listeria floridensis FSL S10-1187]|uniref:N-acetyldiaminopimelate deacetylase n=1 Tax=Listeria floridensis FSL S10-1187 TaxID=1265817 RepID=A0ABP3B2Y4_9LIST|nr:N-acetyldiaminopimelate deacetylase [Listeria floridensis]EUJ33477.1 putative N-acyl-L-amino acid amidohydrolase [Listeria floridensis FSL S10-1187]
MNEFIEIRRKLHQIPETGFEEVKTQRFLLDYIQNLHCDFLEMETWRTGILVRLAGTAPVKTIGWRTDIDALPMEEETGLAFASTHEGRMHACGHDFHMSIALGVLNFFAQNQPKNNLVFIFQPAEEGPGGAKPILESDVFKRFYPDEIFGLHIAPEYKVGEIATKEGLLFANTSELFISFKGRAGHAAYPHLANDMVVAASEFVGQMQTIISRNVDPMDAAVITVGKISGGDVQNVIAERAYLDGTIRTAKKETMELIWKRLRELARGMEEAFQCEVTFRPGSDYCQVYNHAAETERFVSFLKDEFPDAYVEAKAAMTGEDFGYFLEAIPGMMFWLGVDSPYGLHHSKLNPKEEAIPFAISVLTKFLAK